MDWKFKRILKGNKINHFFLTSPNKRVSGSGFQPSPKSPSETSDTRRTLSEVLDFGRNGRTKNDINRRRR